MPGLPYLNKKLLMDVHPPSPVPPVVSAVPGAFGTKLPSTVAFAVGVLLFFLPFIDIKCNDVSLKTISGVKLATGFDVRDSRSNSLFDDPENTTQATSNKKGSHDPYMLALAALALGAAGLFLSFLNNNKAGGIGGFMTGLLAGASMIGMMIDVKTDLKKETLSENSNNVKISIDFTPWFFISLLAFLAAAYFSYRRWKTLKTIPS
jgi:hypothetical protein